MELLQQHSTRSSEPHVVGRKTSPFVALLLSFITPGLGAAYNGQTSKALVHFTIFASFFQMATVTDGTPFFVLGMIGTWLFAAVDAVRTAQLLRAGLAPDAEADAITKRLYGNPLAWGIVLIVLGAVFLLHTIFGITLPMRQILPAVLVLLGAYMLFDWIQNRPKRDALKFENVRQPPSVTGGMAGITGPRLFPAGETRFGTGELSTQVSARDSKIRPVEPRS